MHELMKQIKEAIAREIRTPLGATVEITLRGTNEYTISGELSPVQAAATWLQAQGIMTFDSSYYDAETEEAYWYMKGVKA